MYYVFVCRYSKSQRGSGSALLRLLPGNIPGGGSVVINHIKERCDVIGDQQNMAVNSFDQPVSNSTVEVTAGVWWCVDDACGCV